jgi:hypothetical protein
MTDVQLKGEIAATVERAAADDPRVLRARIAELEKRPAELPDHQKCNSELAMAEESIDEANRENQRLLADREVLLSLIGRMKGAMQNASQGIISALDEYVVAIDRITAETPAPEYVAPKRNPEELVYVKPAAPRAERLVTMPVGDLGGGHVKILEALAMRHPEPSTRNQVATLSGYAARVLEVVAGAYPKTLTKAQVAEAVGMSAGGGGFANYLGRLRGLGLIEYVSTGVVRASADLFP